MCICACVYIYKCVCVCILYTRVCVCVYMKLKCTYNVYAVINAVISSMITQTTNCKNLFPC